MSYTRENHMDAAREAAAKVDKLMLTAREPDDALVPLALVSIANSLVVLAQVELARWERDREADR